MKILPGGCRLFDPGDGDIFERGNWTSAYRIGKSTGAKQISQTINTYQTGRSAAIRNPSSEEALYVVKGEGICTINGFDYELRADTGVFIPIGAEYTVENRAVTPLKVVSACCPEDSERIIREQSSVRAAGNRPNLTVHASDREKLPATAGREFCVLVGKDLGCKEVTQFVGWIPPSSAPFHCHKYEEVVFVLDGRGILHVEDESHPFESGSSIYLAVGVQHCLENPGPSPVRVLGVFYPSGSPAAAYSSG